MREVIIISKFIIYVDDLVLLVLKFVIVIYKN
jgi:hypothetical protein